MFPTDLRVPHSLRDGTGPFHENARRRRLESRNALRFKAIQVYVIPAILLSPLIIYPFAIPALTSDSSARLELFSIENWGSNLRLT